ncbi:hotdog fold domain-containing protein [Microbacterium sp. A94]|uniref:hotdog fold domain-containing protein n=1 Tax=Microbacterium sp. A94 TaxID=3450717 RepID=UPI003F42C68C
MPEADLPEHLRALPGTALTTGTVSIPAAEAPLLVDVLGPPGPVDELHPIYAYLATQRGIGMSVGEVCALAHFDIDDGPMLGSVQFEYVAPMRPDTEYRVEGTILGITRKQGRAAGIFDLLDFEERLVDDDGNMVASARLSFVLPRKENLP